MAGKYSFHIENQDHTRVLPDKVIIGCQETETAMDVCHKLIGFIFFHRERLQIDTNLHNDNIPFVPDLCALDYELRPQLWVECGECTVNKLDKLAVKAPEAELWVIKRSSEAAEDLLREMKKAELRKDRYNILALDGPMFEEMLALLKSRNNIMWLKGSVEELEMQLDFNGLWFELPFKVYRF